MSILLMFLDALDAIYLSKVQREIMQHYQQQTIALGVIPRIGEKLILDVSTTAAYFEVVEVIHRKAIQGRFQVDLYLKACLPPMQSQSRSAT